MREEAVVARRSFHAHPAVVIRERGWPLVVWGAMLSWSIALFATVRIDYRDFRLARFDLGNMAQAVWSTTQGRPLEVTDSTGEQILRLGSHVDPILVLFAPAWLIFPTPLVLAAVQIGACALGALPVFWLARRHVGSEQAAGLFALAYLAYPWLAWTALDAMHPATLAIPVLLYAIWFLDGGRLWAFAGCAVLVFATGELMGLSVAALGVWYWLARGRPRAGLTIAAAGAGWTATCLVAIIPAFRGEASPFYDRFASVGGSPEGVISTAFTDPGAIVSAVTSSSDLTYLLWLGAPLLGLFFFTPLALVVLPQLAINALSDWPTTTDPRHHYIAAIVPALFAATVIGAKRVGPGRRSGVALTVVALCLAFSLVLGPWPGSPGTRPVGFHAVLPESHVEALAAAVDRVPDGVPVSTTNIAGSHLAERRYLYSVPVVRDADWIVLDTWNTWMPATKTRKEGLQPERMRAFLDRLQTSAQWQRVFERDGVLIFERKDRR